MRYLFALLLAIPSPLFSQGYQVNLQGQTQQGMGSAGSALILGPSTLFYNPGTSSFVNNNSVEVGMTPTLSNSVFQDANNGETWRTNSPVGTPFAAYGIYNIKDSSRLKLGLAVYTPFGSTVSWEDGWTGRFALTRLKLLSIFAQPTVSFRVNDKIGIGVGFVYSYGKVNLQKDLPITDQDGNYASAELSGTSHGFGFNAGIILRPTNQLAFGISYRSQINMNVSKGNAQFNVPASLDEKFPDGPFSSSLPLPQVFTLGMGITPNENLSIAFDANYIGWEAYDTLAFDYETNTESLEDTKSPREYVSTIAIKLGAQYRLMEKYFIRLGTTYAVSPVQSGYVTPETPDANRWNFTGGFGYKLNNAFQLDASFLITKLKRTDTNIETNLSGTFTTIVIAPGLSLNYSF